MNTAAIATRILADSRKTVAMPATVSAALRAIGKRDKADRHAQAAFAEGFERLPKDTRTLVEVLKRCSNDHSHLERRANRLRWSLAHGWMPGSVTDVCFMAALTLAELRMTDEAFVKHLEDTWPDQPPAPPLPRARRGIRPSRLAKARVWLT